MPPLLAFQGQLIDYNSVPSLAALQTVRPYSPRHGVVTGGYASDGDGGGGKWYWDAESVETANGGTIIAATGVTTGRWKRIIEGDYSVAWFGALGDGVTDDLAAFDAALAAIPERSYGWAYSTARLEHSVGLYVPNTSAFYRVTDTIVIPATKNLRLYGPNAQSCRIELDHLTETLLLHILEGDSQKSVTLENLIFSKGGLALGQGNRRHLEFKNLTFNGTPSWAVDFHGESTVSVFFTQCWFSECAKGINVGYTQTDDVYIEKCAFIRNRGVDVKICTSGVHVRDCDFEIRDDHANTYQYPFIHLDLDPSNARPGGDVVIDACRLGNENSPPREMILVGPIDSTSSVICGPIKIRNCAFKGSYGGAPTSEQGSSAIRFNMVPVAVEIAGNSFENPFQRLLNEAYMDGGVTQTQRPRLNVWANNAVTGLPTVAAFSHAGQGFDFPTPFDQQIHRPAYFRRAARNLLARTHALDTWGVSGNITVAQDAVGPDGVAGSGATITRTGSGSASIFRASAANVAGPVVFSVWLKAGTASRARIYLNSGSVFQGGVQRVLTLTSEWRRYWCVAPLVTSAQAWTATIAHGIDTDPATSGTILAAFPQLEQGFEPTDFLDNPDASTIHAERPFQSLVVGGAGGRNVVTLDTAAPASGYWRRGDVVLNSAAGDGEPFGWQCVASGTPGTWKVIGYLNPPDPALDALTAGSAFQSYLASGDYVTAAGGSVGAPSNTLGDGELRASPIFVPESLTLTRIGLGVTGAGSAGCTFRLGIYADDGNGFPGALVLDAGTIAGDAIAEAEIVISQALDAGTYWLAGVQQGAPVSAPTVRIHTGSLPGCRGTTAANVGSNTTGYRVTGVTGALPDPFGSPGVVSATPRVFVKR